MPTRRLGSDGPRITALGFGARAVGGGDRAFGWVPQDDRDSIAAIHRALERGVSWIDTAGAYGLGRFGVGLLERCEPIRHADSPQPPLSRNLAPRDAPAPAAWTLAWPGVSGAIVGGRDPDPAAIEATGAGDGPARPSSLEVVHDG